MDKQKAREFLRRLNDLQQEFGMRLNPGDDGDLDAVEDAASGETAYVTHDRWEWLLSADYDERHPVKPYDGPPGSLDDILKKFYTGAILEQMRPVLSLRHKG